MGIPVGQVAGPNCAPRLCTVPRRFPRRGERPQRRSAWRPLLRGFLIGAKSTQSGAWPSRKGPIISSHRVVVQRRCGTARGLGLGNGPWSHRWSGADRRQSLANRSETFGSFSCRESSTIGATRRSCGCSNRRATGLENLRISALSRSAMRPARCVRAVRAAAQSLHSSRH